MFLNSHIRVQSDLRAFREALGLSLEDLAARTSFSVAYLSRLERGERRLTLSVAARILAAMRQDRSESPTP